MAIAPLGAGLAPERRADLNLLVSELVNNAVVHGSGRIELQLERRRDAVWAQVTDEGTGFEAALNAVTHRRPAAGACACSTRCRTVGGWRRARRGCGSSSR